MTNKLKVKYGLWGASSLIVGTIIGAGIFTKTKSILSATQGNNTAAILAWIIGTVCTILGVLLVNEIASKEIKTGGMQTYAEASWGKLFGYVVGFAETFLYVPGTLVILAFYAVTQVYTILGLDVTKIPVTWTTIAVGLVVVFHILVNIYSTFLTKILSYGSLLIKLIPLFLVIICALFVKPDINFVNSLSKVSHVTKNLNWMQIIGLATNALVGVMFAYEGWIYIGTISQEVENAKRNVPLALILGTGFIAFVYIAFTLASLHVIPGTIWADSNANVDTGSVVSALFGAPLAKTLNIAILISIVGGLNGFSIVSIRLPYALAIRNQIVGAKKVAKISNKNNIPHLSGYVMLIASLAWLLAAYLFGYVFKINSSIGAYEYFDNVMETWIANMPVAIFWIFYCCIFVGAFLYRWKHRNVESKGFQLPLWLNIIFVVIASFGGILVVRSTIYDANGWNITGVWAMIIGLLVTLSSFIFIPFIKKFNQDNE